MIETQISEIDLETLTKRVREELDRLKQEMPFSIERFLTPTQPCEAPPVESVNMPQAPHPESASLDGPMPLPVESSNVPPASHQPPNESSPAPPEAPPVTPPGAEVDFRSLNVYAAGRFVDHAYRAVLGRAPDSDGFAHLVDALCSGRVTKAELVAHLRWSPEGRAHGVRVRGLWHALALSAFRKIPLLGGLLRRLDALEHAGARQAEETAAQIESIHNAAARQAEETAARIESIHNAAARQAEEKAAQIKAIHSDIQEAIRESHHMLASHLQEVVHPRLDALQNGLENLRQALFPAIQDLQQRFHELLSKEPLGHLQNHARAIAQLREALADHQRRLAFWTQCWPPPLPLSASQQTQPQASSDSACANSADAKEPHTPAHLAFAADARERLLDAFYTSLEEAFRGDSMEIRERLRFYLPYVQKLSLDLAPVPVIDAGCGRGEWLDLLRSEGYEAVGVDMNRLMVARCREKGLHAVEADAVEYLRRVGPGCVGAVTAFQLIEHLDLQDLVRFLDAAFECLVPGGMLLCETPNPENLLVSSYSFYLDPTHKHPIPPPVAVFLLESAGFCDVAVLRPPRTPPPESEEIRNLPKLLQKILLAEEDYAVIGYKPPCRHEL